MASPRRARPHAGLLAGARHRTAGGPNPKGKDMTHNRTRTEFIETLLKENAELKRTLAKTDEMMVALSGTLLFAMVVCIVLFLEVI